MGPRPASTRFGRRSVCAWPSRSTRVAWGSIPARASRSTVARRCSQRKASSSSRNGTAYKRVRDVELRGRRPRVVLIEQAHRVPVAPHGVPRPEVVMAYDLARRAPAHAARPGAVLGRPVVRDGVVVATRKPCPAAQSYLLYHVLPAVDARFPSTYSRISTSQSTPSRRDAGKSTTSRYRSSSCTAVDHGLRGLRTVPPSRCTRSFMDQA